MRVLDACFAPHGEATPGDCAAAQSAGLEPFQTDAFHRLRGIIARRGGGILADSVGLGKTHVAVAMLHAELNSGATAIVVAPPQLRSHWKRHMRGLVRCRWISHTALSRARPRATASFIVVDEAHAFRNPHARRYASLALLCENARVLLLTATPVNNSLLDFYHLVRLFSGRNAFGDLGVPDLLSAVESAMHGGSAAELRRVADDIMVRRTRRAVSCAQQTPSARPHLRFPVCGPVEVFRYRPSAERAGLLELVRDTIPALTFPAHRLSGHETPRELMRLGLLKRLESSPWAFHASIGRHVRLLEHFIEAAREGLLFDPHDATGSSGEVDGAVQLSLPSLALRPWPRSLDRARLTAAAQHDLVHLRRLCSALPAGLAAADPKLLLLHSLLDSSDGKVLLFTEYQATARGVWHAIADRGGVALIHGSDARLGRGRAGRRTVIERFAPVANHARAPRAAESVRLLIATDVLAEGLNLQDASIVVSYDLPWNPVRLAQRIGRIDRLGSPHARIRAIAFAPERDVEALLGLMSRIRRKLRQIRMVGGDAPWSLAGTRRPARLIALIDAAGEARERVRAVWSDIVRAGRWTGTGHDIHDVASVAVVPWRHDHEAALACFRTGREPILVLVRDGAQPQLNTAACWDGLADALGHGITDRMGTARYPDTDPGVNSATEPRDDTTAPGTSRDPDEELRAAALRAEAAARRAIRADPRRPAHRDRGAAQAGAVVLRWLASRPGGVAQEDAEVADLVLRTLGAGCRSGTDMRLESALHDRASPDEAMKSLLSSLPLAGQPGSIPGEPEPDLIAVLLFRPTQS
jgi:hypothetical protein